MVKKKLDNTIPYASLASYSMRLQVLSKIMSEEMTDVRRRNSSSAEKGFFGSGESILWHPSWSEMILSQGVKERQRQSYNRNRQTMNDEFWLILQFDNHLLKIWYIAGFLGTGMGFLVITKITAYYSKVCVLLLLLALLAFSLVQELSGVVSLSLCFVTRYTSS